MAALGDSLALLFSELVDGPRDQCYMLNTGDPGLLKSLEQLPAAAASTVPRAGGASIAAHVDHVTYGLTLLNRWVAGEENPWAAADWTLSWKRQTVTSDEWATLRAEFAAQARHCQAALAQADDLEGVELNGAIGIVVHLAYHMGAIRQIDRSLRGPSAEDVVAAQ